ncbi:MAG TPA: hypothetical protein VJ547_01775 [Candidatus Thermoplasmatota archaeon]|nr:hypothetical protein [Candidatus Thermoplasmatota archaeon]
MANYVIELLPIGAQFYAKDANGGEGILTNPTTPRVAIFDGAGVQVAGSPFAMVALPVAITGVRYYGWTPAAIGQYAYVCYDAAEPTPTITHSQGILKVEVNDLDLVAGAGFATATDSLDAASTKLDALPTAAANADAVWDELTSGHVAAGSEGKAVVDILAFGAAPTAASNADAVWDEATSGHVAVGSFGKKVGDLTITTDAAIADAVWDEQTSGHTATGSTGKALGVITGPGAGNILVTIDTGGANNLKPILSGGAALAGVLIQAFLKTDWDAGNVTYATYGKGQTESTSTGAFSWPLILAAATYTLSYTLANYQGTTKEVTVS